MVHSREYSSFDHAKSRCNNPRATSYADYGGRGIEFLFTSFAQFFTEIGFRPPGTTLDRIDNDGNYEPGNVRWSTPSQQKRNQRLRNSLVVSVSNRLQKDPEREASV